MPRPCKRRRVCARPFCLRFGPLDQEVREAVVMTVDEFETIRLIDLERMTQEQCAAQMGVARTTIQAIYGSARFKLAQCLALGRELEISGGEYELCDAKDGGCICGKRCWKQKMGKSEGGRKMRIAVTYENGQVFQHFGHTEYFKVYEVEDGKVLRSEVVSTNGQGHGALAGVLGGLQAEILICGGIGPGAKTALAEAGITLYGGVTGDADQAVDALLKGTLSYNPGVSCDHHGEQHHGDHSCGEHGCGEHGHGEHHHAGHGCGEHGCGGHRE